MKYILVMFLIISSSAYGHVKWTEMSIPFYIQETSINGQDSIIFDSIERINERIIDLEFYFEGYSELSAVNSGEVLISWVSIFDMYLMTNNFKSLGRTVNTVNITQGTIIKSRIYLSEMILSRDNNCQRHTIMHELVHAIGFQGHNLEYNSLMYKDLTNDCSNTLTLSDISELSSIYEIDLCFVDTSSSLDFYFPSIEYDSNMYSIYLQCSDNGAECVPGSLSGKQYWSFNNDYLEKNKSICHNAYANSDLSIDAAKVLFEGNYYSVDFIMDAGKWFIESVSDER